MVRMSCSLLVVLVAVSLGACGGGGGGGDAASPVEPPPRFFVHTATSANTSFQSTELDHASLNGNPTARILVTQNFSPMDVYNDHVVGVWYSDTTARWNIYNEDIATIPDGASFNVRVITDEPDSFTFTTNSPSSNWFPFDRAETMGNDTDRILITHNYNPGATAPGVYNDFVSGVFYEPSVSTSGAWSGFNQSGSTAVDGASYNVSVLPTGPMNFIHKVTAANRSFHTTEISHPALDGNPDAVMQVTQFWDADRVYNDRVIGVFYHPTTNRWNIFNQDFVTLPLNAAFNVSIDQ